MTNCPAVLMIKGEDFACDWPTTNDDGGHPGWAHSSRAAESIWTEDKTLSNEQQGSRRANLLDGTTEFMRLAKQPAGEWFAPCPETEREVAEGVAAWKKLRGLRIDLLAEEYNEYLNAERAQDLTEIVDGLLDVIVIAWGTLITYIGEDKAKAAAAEVVRSNRDKVLGEGLPIFREDGKVLKPEVWTAPDIAGAIA